MITVQELRDVLERAVVTGQLRPNSEVRFINRDLKDCSMEGKHAIQSPGVDRSGMPLDRRYGDGVLYLAQEQVMREATSDTLRSLDWID